MKKSCFIVIVIIFVLIVTIVISYYNFDKNNNGHRKLTLRWIPEESYFVDYKFVSNNRIRFRYSISYVNEGKEVISASITARFLKKELDGWVKGTEFDTISFSGNEENGNLLYVEIMPGEKRSVTYCFEGEYLGGRVNEALSPPEEIIIVESYPDRY